SAVKARARHACDAHQLADDRAVAERTAGILTALDLRHEAALCNREPDLSDIAVRYRRQGVDRNVQPRAIASHCNPSFGLLRRTPEQLSCRGRRAWRKDGVAVDDEFRREHTAIRQNSCVPLLAGGEIGAAER